jgi:tRNA(adenine34) deaminase
LHVKIIYGSIGSLLIPHYGFEGFDHRVDMPAQFEQWMREALKQAQHAYTLDEVPVGAVLVLDDQCIASAFNQTIHACDPTAHAEILLLRKAAKALGNHRLLDTTLFVTLEPCLMCWGAIVQARVKQVVFAAKENKAQLSSYECFKAINHRLNHSVQVTSGVLQAPCSELLSAFFKEKRQCT